MSFSERFRFGFIALVCSYVDTQDIFTKGATKCFQFKYVLCLCSIERLQLHFTVLQSDDSEPDGVAVVYSLITVCVSVLV